MLKNYFKITLRTLAKNKVHGLINIIGLAFAMATSLLIVLWVEDELTYDHFHENIESIYRIMEHQQYEVDKIFTTASTPGPLAPYLKETYPEVVRASRYTWEVENLLRAGTEGGNFEQGRYVDPDFLEMFSLKFIEGDMENALEPMNSIILTRSLAKKYFGDENTSGRSMTMNDTTELMVTAVIEDLPSNSSLEFDYLLSFKRFWKLNQSWLDEWGNNNVRAFVQLEENTSSAAFEEKIAEDVKKKNEHSTVTLFIQPMEKWHLYSKFENGQQVGGRITNVKIFSIIAVVILLIACINFMNLSTAQATKRAKEVGLRKVVGAFRQQLAFQFLGESVIYSLLSVALAVVFVWLLLPTFNEITAKQLSFNLTRGSLLVYIFSVTIATGLLAGVYPAFYLARFQPAKVLKGMTRSGKQASSFRKALVIMQFTLAIILIASTIVVYQQLLFLEIRDIGFNRDRLLFVEMQQDMHDNYETIRKELLNDPSIENVTAMNMPPLSFHSSTSGVEWEGKGPDELILFSNIVADFDFIKTFEMRLAEGRGFDRSLSTDTSNFLINEEAARRIGFKGSAVDQPITLWGDRKGKIVGVIKDFNFASSHEHIEPLLVALEPEWFRYIVVRASQNNIQGAIQALEKYHEMYAPAYPFEYRFVDDEWMDKYKSEQQTGRIFTYFALLAVIISCLGLFALAAYAAERRVKEIGVRKVMGATLTQITGLMTKEFSVLVIVSALLACPIAWYLMNLWLEDFAYKVDVEVATLVFATLVAFVIAIATVSFHAIKAAMGDPVKALRYE